MKPFLGIDLTANKKNEQINGQEFLIQTPSSLLSDFLETSNNKAEETIEKTQIPLLFRVIKFICGVFVLLAIGGILKAEVTFMEGYQNAPWLYWGTGICAVVWLILCGIRMLEYMWGKCYPPKWGINLFVKGDGFAI